jgi:hypothetical protein
MRYRIVKKGGKYVRKFSLDSEDWVTILVVVLVFCMVAINIFLRG